MKQQDPRSRDIRRTSRHVIGRCPRPQTIQDKRAETLDELLEEEMREQKEAYGLEDF